MFRKSRKDKVVDQASHTSVQAKELFEKVVPVVGHAAESTREWAAPRVVAAREWAAPRAQKGLDAAAPRVELAVDAVTPKIDAARDKLVDEVLPRLVDAINAATTQAAAAKDHAQDVGSDVLQVIKGEAVVKPKKKHRLRKLLMLGGLVGAGAAAFKALRKPKDDPWAVPAASTSSWAPATTPAASPAAAAEAAAAEDRLDEAAASEATEASSDGETIDLGSSEGQADAPDGDQPGKITPSAAAKKAKARDDG
jgi:hypothetical protein